MEKTKENLQNVWKLLDDACGSLDEALTQIGLMNNISEGVEKSVERIDFDSLVELKNKIEELIEEQ